MIMLMMMMMVMDRIGIHAFSKNLLHCIVVGSRCLMPPDALQPKAYCTNPGLLVVPTCTARCLHQRP